MGMLGFWNVYATHIGTEPTNHRLIPNFANFCRMVCSTLAKERRISYSENKLQGEDVQRQSRSLCIDDYDDW